MAKLSDACRSLQRAKEAAMSRLEQLDEERREMKASLKSLDRALKALGQESADGVKTATQEDVIALAKEMLSSKALLKAELLRSIARRLKRRSVGTDGIDAFLEQACASNEFRMDENDMVSLSLNQNANLRDEGGSNVG